MKTIFKTRRARIIASIVSILALLLLVFVVLVVRELLLRSAFSDVGGHLTVGANYCVEPAAWPPYKKSAIPSGELSALPRVRDKIRFLDPKDPDRMYMAWLSTVDYPDPEVQDHFNVVSFKSHTIIAEPMDLNIVRKHRKEILANSVPLVDLGRVVPADWRPGREFSEAGNRRIEASRALPKTGSYWTEVTWSPGFKLAVVQSADQQDKYYGTSYLEVYRASTRELLAQVKFKRFKTQAYDLWVNIDFASDRDILLTYPSDNNKGSAICRFPEEGTSK